MSKKGKNDGLTITVTMALYADFSRAEICLVEAHLGELLQQIIRETNQED